MAAPAAPPNPAYAHLPDVKIVFKVDNLSCPECQGRIRFVLGHVIDKFTLTLEYKKKEMWIQGKVDPYMIQSLLWYEGSVHADILSVAYTGTNPKQPGQGQPQGFNNMNMIGQHRGGQHQGCNNMNMIGQYPGQGFNNMSMIGQYPGQGFNNMNMIGQYPGQGFYPMHRSQSSCSIM